MLVSLFGTLRARLADVKCHGSLRANRVNVNPLLVHLRGSPNYGYCTPRDLELRGFGPESLCAAVRGAAR